MRVYGHTAPPIGFVQFCQRDPAECRSVSKSLERMELSPARLAEVTALNRQVNTAIRPATDKELHGVEEHWSYPTHDMRGDCEDYVLLKRKLLMELGWPPATLLITVVRDERKEGHAVLTLRTSQGDFVLDNKNDDVLAWHRTPYEFVMRQSYLEGQRWMSLEPEEDPSSVAVSGVRAPQ
jgi:predicted transglutaminase-like cysteine proteinase